MFDREARKSRLNQFTGIFSLCLALSSPVMAGEFTWNPPDRKDIFKGSCPSGTFPMWDCCLGEWFCAKPGTPDLCEICPGGGGCTVYIQAESACGSTFPLTQDVALPAAVGEIVTFEATVVSPLTTLSYDWAVLDGADLVVPLDRPPYDNTFRVLTIGEGKVTVSVKVQSHPCGCGAPCKNVVDGRLSIGDADTDADGIMDLTECAIGSDWNDPDSDDDDICDGDEDPDSDGLVNTREEIFGTNPLDADTDNGGVNDYRETVNHSDPLDECDDSTPPAADQLVPVELTIGDDSTSNSEVYMLQVGNIRYRSSGCDGGFGAVVSETFYFRRGCDYTVIVKHLASSGDPPDYDGEAFVEPQSQTGCVAATVSDPEGLLDEHECGIPGSCPQWWVDKEATLHAPLCCEGDLNADGTVNGQDYAIVLAAWGVGNCCVGTFCCPADFNHDGTVNGFDLAVVTAAWGPCP